MTETPVQEPRKHHAPALRLLCRKQYVRGEVGSLAQLAKLHGISGHTVRAWSDSENWPEHRESWLEQQNRKDETPAQSPKTSAEVEQGGDYVGARLMRVRVQLDRLDELMLTESDPQKLDRLASAQARLSEQERIMAGRPLPGSRRPAKEPAAPRRNILALPVDSERLG